MAVEKVILLDHGGTVIITLNGVNLFSVNDEERALLTGLADTVLKYERQREVRLRPKTVAPVVAATPAPAPEEAGTDG